MGKVKDYLLKLKPLAKECLYGGCMVCLCMMLSALIFSVCAGNQGLSSFFLKEYAVCMVQYTWICLLETVTVTILVNRYLKVTESSSKDQ